MTGSLARSLPLCFLPLLLFQARPTTAESPACAQARAIVEDVAEQYAGGSPDHSILLGKLATARNLCSSFGEAWKYSYCSALALGKDKEARIFRDRALFNSVSDLTCPAAGGTVIPQPAAPLPSHVRAKYALVVGIGQFRDERITTLRYAAKDAEDLAATLTDQRYGRFDRANVKLLTDKDATRANILDGLQQIFLKAQEDDLVFIYLSSHGSPRQAEQGLNGVGYIVTSDTASDKIFVDGIDYESFSRQISLLRARRKAVFLDTCFSGQAPRPGEKALFIEAAGIDAKTAGLFLSGEGTYVVTSSKASERSFESETLENSYFTYFLIQALRRVGEPPTIKDIFSFLKQEVPAAVARDKGQPQHPQIFPAESRGDLRIGVAALPTDGIE